MIPPEEEQETKNTGQSCLYNAIAVDISEGRRIGALNNLVLQHPRPAKEKIIPIIEDTEAEIDAFSILMCNWLKQQAEQHQIKRDIAIAAQEQMRKVLENVPLSPISDKNTGEATIHKDNELHNLCYHIVIQLVIHFLNVVNDGLSVDLITIVAILEEMLYVAIADSDVGVKISSRLSKRLVKAVYQDLCKEDGPGMVVLNLQRMNQCFYQDVIMSLKRHPLKQPHKCSIRIFLRP